MDRDPNNSELFNSLHPKDEETDKSFVGKVKSIITNTPLSKWFWRQDDNGSTVRIRDEEFEDEEILEMQPPTKRVKLPVDSEASNCNTIYFKQTSTNTTADKIPKTEFISLHEPVAGPSGINSRKLHSNATTSTTYSARSVFNTNELINGHKDSDSDESTSGYSSVPRISSKEQVCGSQESSKQTSPLQSSPRNSRSLFQTSTMNSTRSLFAERSLSPNVNTSMSSRRPSFNASTFGSPNFIDKTIATKKVVESPFYNGRTIYGGASAYSRSLGRSSQDLKSSLRNSVDVKPVNKTSDNGNVVLGKTAQRILDTLEQYSTPINDAKKIPLATRKRGGLLSEYTGTNPYIIRHSKVASNKELQVPSVPDLLKMKQRMRLQDSTEIVKQIAASSKSNLNAQLYSIHTNENEKEKHTSKVRTKISAPHRQKQLDMEPAPEVHLNPVSLPITTLPKFDLKIPPPESLKRDSENISRALKQSEKSLLSKSPQAQLSRSKTLETETNHVHVEKRTTTADIVDYKFSDPLVISENIKSIIAINDFKFSEPVCKKSKPESLSNSTLNFKMPENKASILPITGKTNTVGQKESPTLLKTGSVMDILGKKDTSLMEKFKPPQGTWECTVCMVRNQPEKTKCVACETPKVMPDKQNLNKDGFGSQFKLSSDKWECSSCMVRNNNSDMKCVACTSPKPGTIAVSNTTTPKTNTSGFGGKFKLSSDSWECPTCMIRNKNELTKCAACETANPKVTTTLLSTMNKFLPPPSSWECTTCLVKNKEGDLKCVACETPKAGEKMAPTGFGNVFKTKEDEWECAVCMVRNKADKVKCQCCEAEKPGSVSKSNTNADKQTDKKPIFSFGVDKTDASGFSFGIPSTITSTPLKPTTNASSIFGGQAKAESSAAAFSFGIPTATQSKPVTPEYVKMMPAIVTKPVLPTDNPLLKPNEKLPEKAEVAPSDFKFKVPKSDTHSDKLTSEQKPEDTAIVSSTPVSTVPKFTFKPVAVNGDISKPLIFGNKAETIATTTTFNVPSTTTNLFSFRSKQTVDSSPSVSTAITKPSQSSSTGSIFKFGSSSHSTPDKPSTLFSSIISTAPTNGFVTTNTPSFGSTSVSNFKATATSSSEVKPFAFNPSSSVSNEPPNKVAIFSFSPSSGSSIAGAASKAPGFNFGDVSKTPTFSFTSGKTEVPSFGVPSNTVFGASAAAKNGTFNFGSVSTNNTSQKAGFSFGANVNSTAAPLSGFNFGTAAAAATTSTSGTFNFAGAPPVFDTNVKPSFNFTDGNLTKYTAQPSTDAGPGAPRRIKRAIRRTQR